MAKPKKKKSPPAKLPPPPPSKDRPSLPSAAFPKSNLNSIDLKVSGAQRSSTETKSSSEHHKSHGSPRSEHSEATFKKASVSAPGTEIESPADSNSAPVTARSGSSKVAETAATTLEAGSVSDVESAESSSWAELVKSSGTKMKRKGKAFTLDSGELCVKIPDEVIIRNQNRWEKFIIAQFNGNAPVSRSKF